MGQAAGVWQMCTAGTALADSARSKLNWHILLKRRTWADVVDIVQEREMI